MGADEVIDFSQEDPVAAIKRLTEGRGVDVAIEALGTQETFEACLEAGAYDLFGNQRDGVVKVAIEPTAG